MTTSYDDYVAANGSAASGTGPAPLGVPFATLTTPNMISTTPSRPAIPVPSATGIASPYAQGPAVGPTANGPVGSPGANQDAAVAEWLRQPTEPDGGPGQPVLTQDGVKTTTVPARYYQGDEYQVASGLPPEQRAAIQQQMRDAGLIGKTTPLTWGEWDATSANAFQEVLTQANINGVDWQTQMTTLTTQAAAHPGGGVTGTRPALTIRQTSPEDLRQVFNQTSQQTLGRRATESELESMIAGYNAREAAAQKQQYDQTYAADGTPGPGGGTKDAPTAQNYAAQTIEETNPTEFGATNLANTFDSFQSILGKLAH